MMTSFGERLRALRKGRGFSQSRVARDITEHFCFDMSQNSLSIHERSEYAPREEVLRLFANYYDVSITALLGGVEPDVTEGISIENYIDGLIHNAPASNKRFTYPYQQDNTHDDDTRQIYDDMRYIGT